ncbi:MAG: hypothetical protein Q7K54_05190 [Candidatus Parcubacteria bacterium]|nr:hypothetical protein [Candidatus Parcubacteria bacterium]
MIKDLLKDEISLNELKDHGKSWNTLEGNTSIQDIGKEKLESIKTIIDEINNSIKGREKLSRDISSETEKINHEIERFISENTVSSPEDSKERSALRQKQVELSELSLNEKVSCWKDIALLKRELRELTRELAEKEERINTLNKILEEN